MQINTLDNRFEYIPLNPHRKHCQKYRAYGVESFRFFVLFCFFDGLYKIGFYFTLSYSEH